jgi:hypothetical protein
MTPRPSPGVIARLLVGAVVAVAVPAPSGAGPSPNPNPLTVLSCPD